MTIKVYYRLGDLGIASSKWDATTYTYNVTRDVIRGRAEKKGEGASGSTASGRLRTKQS